MPKRAVGSHVIGWAFLWKPDGKGARWVRKVTAMVGVKGD